MIEEELPDELENDLDDIEPVGDESQLYEHFRVVVDKGQAMVRVDKYLFERIVNASRNRIQKAAEDGFVMANGKPVKSSYKVKPLDVITVMMDRPRYENEIIPENIPLTIVYEDPYLMVVNKPAGLVVHPGHGNYHGTLVNALAVNSGVVCDGAKPSCAAKIASAIEAGLLGYEMYRHGSQFRGGEGIVSKGVENTIRNISRLAREGMQQTDREIIEIMTGCC